LKEYKYVSPNLSFLERVYLNKFWDVWAATVYPSWIAPNTITLIGTVVLFSAFILGVSYDPQLTGEAPTWTFVVMAIAGFIYQTFDGSDGKHARNTKSGSALGEMFDHGCDSLVGFLYTSYCLHCAQMGMNSWVTILVIVSQACAFFTSNLTLLHQGRQNFNDLDCQEAQVVMQIWMVMGYIYGIAFYTFQVWIPAYPIVLSIFSYLPKEYLTLRAPDNIVEGNIISYMSV